MPTPVTASMLYDLVICPHRITMDLYGDPAKMDEENPFVKMLWEKGLLYEREVIAGLDLPFLDLSACSGEEKERLTLEAMQRGDPFIYGGRIQEPELLGDPDLLRKEPGGYVAGDIKSGAGEESPEDDPRPKLHYAVQLALYTDILERKGLSAGRRAFVWDIHGKEVPYDFAALYGKRNPRTLWQDYQECISQARAIIADRNHTRAAYSGACKLCHWYSACIERLRATDDLTLIPELGSSKRDVMINRLLTVGEFAASNPDAFLDGKKTVFPGIGPDTLAKFHMRAKLLSTKDARPVLRAPVQFPSHDRELFFDIEFDPMRDICYLHGFVERHGRNNAAESFVAFFADECTPESEKTAFADHGTICAASARAPSTTIQNTSAPFTASCKRSIPKFAAARRSKSCSTQRTRSTSTTML